MSKMAPASQKKRRIEDGIRGKTERPKKRIRKQKAYHSSSEESDDSDTGFAPVNLNDSDDEQSQKVAASKSRTQDRKQPAKMKVHTPKPNPAEAEDSSSGSDGSEDDDDDAGENLSTKRKPTSKRNNPEAFSTSISKILSTKLSQSARKDPLLSRSRDAATASSSIANERLEKKAKAKLRADKKEELERGRIKDALGLDSGQAGEVAEEEKRLRKIAQRGVVKLFNAVRAAQVRAEQATREERKKGTIGVANREEKVNEMSKQGFLDIISGKKSQSANS